MHGEIYQYRAHWRLAGSMEHCRASLGRTRAGTHPIAVRAITGAFYISAQPFVHRNLVVATGRAESPW